MSRTAHTLVGSYTDVSTSTVASSLADKDNHNNKQLWSKRAAEASDTGHQWACRDVLETIESPFGLSLLLLKLKTEN